MLAPSPLRPRHLLVAALILPGVAGAAACGDDTAEAQETPTPTLESAYCGPLAALVCGRAVACGCGAAFPSGLEEGACVKAFTATCLEAYAPVAAAIAAGSATLYPERAAACIQELVSSTPGCEAPRGSVALGTCPAWYASEAPVGEACDFPICAGGEGHCVEGVCEARPRAGDACVGYECVPGTVCSEGTCTLPGAAGATCAGDEACEAPRRCIEGRCAALLDAGEACTSTAACAQGLACEGSCAATDGVACTAHEQCGNLALCAAPRSCVPAGGAGAECASASECATGLGCDPSTQRCVSLPGDGEPCADGVYCGVGLGCDQATSLCAPLPGDGETCALGELGPFLCAAGLGCSDAMLCGPMPGEGDTCTLDSRCAEGLGCAFGPEGSFCIVPRTAGEPCENDGACAPDHHCAEGGVCALDVATQEPCPWGNECREGDACGVDEGGTLRCLPVPGEGEPCLFECGAGLVCRAAGDARCVPEICAAL